MQDDLEFAGGTNVWCPECETFVSCKAESTVLPEDRRFLWNDVGVFNRHRICLNCGASFWTAELPWASIKKIEPTLNKEVVHSVLEKAKELIAQIGADRDLFDLATREKLFVGLKKFEEHLVDNESSIWESKS